MPVALAVVAVAAVASTVTGIVSGNQSRAAARHANDLQQDAANEQRASNAQQAAAAARDQYRQDRIKRARIMQSADNSGVENGSGEFGALGSLQTQYATNQGDIQGQYDRGVRIGNDMSEANQTLFNAQQTAGQMQGLSSIFNTIGSVAGAAYGASAKSAKIPGTTSQAVDKSFDNPSDYG
jgi:hypothetical protein